MQYHAHGKLLLSGEYLVLKGTEALAIPCKYGQSLSFSPEQGSLHWKSFDVDNKLWLEASFSESVELISSNLQSADFLQGLLKKAIQISGKPLPSGIVETRLEFPGNWGLGSSSTLTSLIAQWLQVDPYELFFATQNGSGYDIACATAKEPIIYTKNIEGPETAQVSLPAVFEEVFFVHLNQKQNSRPAVANFLKNSTSENYISKISALTHRFLEAHSVKELQQAMDEHEQIMADVLNDIPVKQKLFGDFDGSVKSLGAWGGDFIMALGQNAPAYFKSKGYRTVVSFNEMILS